MTMIDISKYFVKRKVSSFPLQLFVDKLHLFTHNYCELQSSRHKLRRTGQLRYCTCAMKSNAYEGNFNSEEYDWYLARKTPLFMSAIFLTQRDIMSASQHNIFSSLISASKLLLKFSPTASINITCCVCEESQTWHVTFCSQLTTRSDG